MIEPLSPLGSGKAILPADAAAATLIFRLMTGDGPTLNTLRDGMAVDITSDVPTLAHLLRRESPAKEVRKAKGIGLGPIDAIVENSDEAARDRQPPYLLAPIDLQAVKACGVTFVASMTERVVEELQKAGPTSGEAVH